MAALGAGPGGDVDAERRAEHVRLDVVGGEAVAGEEELDPAGPDQAGHGGAAPGVDHRRARTRRGCRPRPPGPGAAGRRGRGAGSPWASPVETSESMNSNPARPRVRSGATTRTPRAPTTTASPARRRCSGVVVIVVGRRPCRRPRARSPSRARSAADPVPVEAHLGDQVGRGAEVRRAPPRRPAPARWRPRRRRAGWPPGPGAARPGGERGVVGGGDLDDGPARVGRVPCRCRRRRGGSRCPDSSTRSSTLGRISESTMWPSSSKVSIGCHWRESLRTPWLRVRDARVGCRPMGQPIVVVEKPSIANPGMVRFETNRALTGMGHELLPRPGPRSGATARPTSWPGACSPTAGSRGSTSTAASSPSTWSRATPPRASGRSSRTSTSSTRPTAEDRRAA